MALACAEALPSAECECGTYANECVPCPDEPGVELPGGDAGVPFLNQDRIDEQNGYYLNQENDGRVTIYTNEEVSRHNSHRD